MQAGECWFDKFEAYNEWSNAIAAFEESIENEIIVESNSDDGCETNLPLAIKLSMVQSVFSEME